MLFRGFLLAGLIGLLGCGGCGGCSSDGFHLDAPEPDATTFGTISLAWSLTDLDGQPIQCDQVGASTVALQLRNRARLQGVPASFSCGNSPSTTQAIEAGIYDVTLELHGQNTTLATAADQRGVVVAAGGDTPLAPVMFAVDARGSLVLSFAAPPSPSNCKSPPQGAGMTGTTITLVHPSGTCAPVTFLRARGATSLGTYTVSCSSPQVTSCIETDETLTVPTLPSGPYTIHVRGKSGATDCWKNDDALQVPPQGQALTETLNLAIQPGC
jgi:hypothetical protein